MHGGEYETNILLHAVPELLRDDWRSADHEAPDRPDLPTLGTARYGVNGVIGRPSAASPEKGATILDSLTDAFGEHVAMLRG